MSENLDSFIDFCSNRVECCGRCMQFTQFTLDKVYPAWIGRCHITNCIIGALYSCACLCFENNPDVNIQTYITREDLGEYYGLK